MGESSVPCFLSNPLSGASNRLRNSREKRPDGVTNSAAPEDASTGCETSGTASSVKLTLQAYSVAGMKAAVTRCDELRPSVRVGWPSGKTRLPEPLRGCARAVSRPSAQCSHVYDRRRQRCLCLRHDHQA